MDRRRTKAVFRLLGDLPFGATAPPVIDNTPGFGPDGIQSHEYEYLSSDDSGT